MQFSIFLYSPPFMSFQGELSSSFKLLLYRTASFSQMKFEMTKQIGASEIKAYLITLAHYLIIPFLIQ